VYKSAKFQPSRSMTWSIADVESWIYLLFQMNDVQSVTKKAMSSEKSQVALAGNDDDVCHASKNDISHGQFVCAWTGKNSVQGMCN